MVLPCVALLAVATCVSTTNAQPGGFGGGTARDLIRRDDVKAEIEAVPDQVEAATARGEGGNRDSIREAFQQLRDLPEDERRAKAQELFAEFRGNADQQVKNALLPDRWTRLQELVFQYSMRGGLARAVDRSSVAEALGITTEKKKEEVKKIAEEAAKELNEKIAKLRKDAEKSLLSKLPADVRSKYKKLAGEPFTFVQQQSRFGGGNRGGGNRGGGNFGGGNRGRGGDQGGRGRGGRDRGGDRRGGRPADDTE